MEPIRILGVGAAHIDRRGRISGTFVPGASNPGTMAEEPGGAVLNVLRTMRYFGAEADIVSAIGGDAAGTLVAAAIEQAKIGDHCAVFLDRATASYTAILNRDGSLVAGLADMDIYETALPRCLRSDALRQLAASADALVLDANLPPDAIGRVLTAAAGKPVHAIAVSPAKVVRLKRHLGALAAVFMNRAEAAALTGMTTDHDAPGLVAALRGQGLRCGVITDGQQTMAAYRNEEAIAFDPPEISDVRDVTGAGDALAAATIVAMARGKALGDAIREGAAAALAAIASMSAVPALEGPAFAEIIEKMPQPRQLARAATPARDALHG